MDAVYQLLQSLQEVITALLHVVMALVNIVLPWFPLLVWIAFWSLAVNWSRAFDILRKGGAIGVLLLMFVSVLVWGSVAPPIEGSHSLFGLTVSNFAGKFVYVTMLTCIALLCGSAQMSGAFGSLVDFSDESAADDAEDSHAH